MVKNIHFLMVAHYYTLNYNIIITKILYFN